MFQMTQKESRKVTPLAAAEVARALTRSKRSKWRRPSRSTPAVAPSPSSGTSQLTPKRSCTANFKNCLGAYPSLPLSPLMIHHKFNLPQKSKGKIRKNPKDVKPKAYPVHCNRISQSRLSAIQFALKMSLRLGSSPETANLPTQWRIISPRTLLLESAEWKPILRCSCL